MTARPAVWALVLPALMSWHCEAALTGLANLSPLLLMLAGLTAVLELWRRGIGPAHFDGRARRISGAARQLGLPVPKGALALRWQSPSGFKLEAKAPDNLELSLPMTRDLPMGMGVDWPNLARGQVLSQITLPDPAFSGFLVYGAEAEAYALLTASVRAALLEANHGGMHVAIEQGNLRVRMHASQDDRVNEAVARLEAVARAIVLLPAGIPQRLCAQVLSDDHRAVRQRALQLLVEGYEHAPACKVAVEYAHSEALDDEYLRRWAARGSGGALSLTEATRPEGAVSLLAGSGGLSLGPKGRK